MLFRRLFHRKLWSRHQGSLRGFLGASSGVKSTCTVGLVRTGWLELALGSRRRHKLASDQPLIPQRGCRGGKDRGEERAQSVRHGLGGHPHRATICCDEKSSEVVWTAAKRALCPANVKFSSGLTAWEGGLGSCLACKVPACTPPWRPPTPTDTHTTNRTSLGVMHRPSLERAKGQGHWMDGECRLIGLENSLRLCCSSNDCIQVPMLVETCTSDLACFYYHSLLRVPLPLKVFEIVSSKRAPHYYLPLYMLYYFVILCHPSSPSSSLLWDHPRYWYPRPGPPFCSSLSSSVLVPLWPILNILLELPHAPLLLARSSFICPSWLEQIIGDLIIACRPPKNKIKIKIKRITQKIAKHVQTYINHYLPSLHAHTHHNDP